MASVPIPKKLLGRRGKDPLVKPSGDLAIDWRNSLTKNLIAAWVPQALGSGNIPELTGVSGNPLVMGAHSGVLPAVETSKYGPGIYMATLNQYASGGQNWDRFLFADAPTTFLSVVKVRDPVHAPTNFWQNIIMRFGAANTARLPYMEIAENTNDAPNVAMFFGPNSSPTNYLRCANTDVSQARYPHRPLVYAGVNSRTDAGAAVRNASLNGQRDVISDVDDGGESGSPLAVPSTTVLNVGGRSDSATDIAYQCTIYACMIWNRALSIDELNLMTERPYDILLSKGQVTVLEIPAGFSVIDVDLDETIYNGQTGVIVTLSGTVSATGKTVFLQQGGTYVEQTVTAQDAASCTITVVFGSLTTGAATLCVRNPV